MIRKRAIAVFVAFPLALATTPGCSDDNKATPQVIVTDATITHGSHTSAECHEDGPLFVNGAIGDMGNPSATPPTAATPVADGQPFGQGTVSVACSVTAAGADSFNVTASVLLSGATGGLLRIDGVFKTTGDQTGIHAQFANDQTKNTYDEGDHNCTVRYTTPFQGVAAGRVWGDITCPNANITTAQATPVVCQASAEFRFENCEQ
jgi:hypothetical protein